MKEGDFWPWLRGLMLGMMVQGFFFFLSLIKLNNYVWYMSFNHTFPIPGPAVHDAIPAAAGRDSAPGTAPPHPPPHPSALSQRGRWDGHPKKILSPSLIHCLLSAYLPLPPPVSTIRFHDGGRWTHVEQWGGQRRCWATREERC